MSILDVFLFVVLLVGNALGLPIWWWLLTGPFRRAPRFGPPRRPLTGAAQAGDRREAIELVLWDD